jgi:hypothetical protein
MPDGFRPGDKVPTTGIYTAKHYQHRLPHEVFAVQGDEFPPCRRCGQHIIFSLVQPATHIGADRDFSSSSEGKTKKARAGQKKLP